MRRVASPNSNSMWEFKCSCGRTGVLSGSALRRSNKCKSCGMAARRKAKGECSFNGLFLRYRHGALSRNLKFSLTKTQFKTLTQSNCFYCGTPPKNKHKGRTAFGEYVYNGVDRLDSKGDYSLKNCVACCAICNRAKSNLTLDEFLVWINNISTRRNK